MSSSQTSDIMMWVTPNYSATCADHPDESHVTRITINVVRTGLRVKQINKFKGRAQGYEAKM